MKQLYLLLSICFLAHPLLSQEKINRQLLIEDLNVLKANLEAYHTGLYTYTTKEEFEQWFSATEQELEDASSLEFFRKLNELNALIKNGHTYFHVNPAQRGKNLLMPSFKIYKHNDRFYIKAGKDPALLGKQIISIDKRPIQEVFNQLLLFKERDGNNLTQPTEELLHSFARTYALQYGNQPQTVLEILDDGTLKEITCSNIPFETVTKKTDFLFDNGGVECSIKDSIALLTVQTFNKEPLKQAKYASKLKALFKSIQKQQINHLIIDIRNNGGGHTESVEKLLAYIYGKPFTFYEDVYRSHKDWDSAIIPTLSQYQKNISSWAFKQGDDGYFRAIAGSDGMKTKQPENNYFKGKLFILTNGSTLSAAAEFAAFVKQYRKATFIGDETGGNKTQNTSGDWLIIGLPNSKVFAFIPYALWKMNVDFENDGHGVKPDHFIQNSIQEELAGEDAVLEFTYELIRKSMADGRQ